MTKQSAKLWRPATLYSMTDCQKHKVIPNGAILTQNDKILWIGDADSIPKNLSELKPIEIPLMGKSITPGLIDCHTHLVYGGQRINEFSQKLSGKSYEDILSDGGGIYATVQATRALNQENLYKVSVHRMLHFLKQGVTTFEIKSGYGLDEETERKMLRVARKIASDFSLDISTTFLGAHVLAPEFRGKTQYIQYLTNEVLPKLVAEGLVDSVDGFCDTMAFTDEELRPLYEKAIALGLGIKMHCDQLSVTQGASLAAALDAWSVDHVEYTDESAIKELARKQVVAVLLPSAYYFLQGNKRPPIDLFRKYGVPMALATDCNPGSSPCMSLLTILNMGCVLFGLSPFEAFLAVTQHAARALRLEHRKGQLKEGFDADFVVWDIEHPDELAYYLGNNPCKQVIIKGNIVYESPKDSFLPSN